MSDWLSPNPPRIADTLSLIKMKKNIILLTCVLFLGLGCQRQLYTEYTSAYKDGVIYLAGTNINFQTDSTFLRTDWTDHLGYGKIGKGRYFKEGENIILVYDGFEDQILEHKQNTKQQIQIIIESEYSTQVLPIKLKIKDWTDQEIIGYKVSLLNSQGNILNENYSDLDGTSKFERFTDDSKYTLKSEYLQSEQLNFEFDGLANIDTTIYLAEHIPYIENGRIDTFKIKNCGIYIQDLKEGYGKLKKK